MQQETVPEGIADDLFQAQVRELGWGVIYAQPGLEAGHILPADGCVDEIGYAVVVLGPASQADLNKVRPIFHRVAGEEPTNRGNLTLYRAMVD